MDAFFDNLIKNKSKVDKIKIYFGNTQNRNESIIDCNISQENVDKVMNQFIGYSNKKNEFKHIVALDKELFTNKNETNCIRRLVTNCDIITIPETDCSICMITERVEKLKEIDFPSCKEYQQNVNCMEYTFNIHAKVKLIIHMENNTYSVFLEGVVDDYLDTTIQYIKNGLITDISKILFTH